MAQEIHSYEEFLKEQKEIKSYRRFLYFVLTCFLIIPGIPLFLVLADYLDNPFTYRNMESVEKWIVVLLVFMPYFLTIQVPPSLLHKISEESLKIRNLSESYPEYAETLFGKQRVTDKIRIILKENKGFYYLLIVSLIALALFAISKYVEYDSSHKYEQALSYYADGNLYEAEKSFRSILRDEYKDKNAYLALIGIEELRKDLDWRDISFRMYEKLDTLTFPNSTLEETEIRDQRIQKVKEIYEKGKKERDYYYYKLNHIEHFSPFVGMPDEYIQKTCLGKSIFQNGKVIGEFGKKRVYQEIYEFGQSKTSSTQKTFSVIYIVTFVATVENNVVVSIKDYRNAPKTRVVSTAAYHPTYNDLHYNVNDYEFADDFYEDWYDEFEDIDDAESYYDEYYTGN